MEKNKIAVKVTGKNSGKVLDILDMFGENVSIFMRGVLKGTCAQGCNSHIEFYKEKEWVGSANDENKKEVKLKEFRNILAKEHLKAGDVVILKNKNAFEGTQYIVAFDKIAPNGEFDSTSYVVIHTDGSYSTPVLYGGYFHTFIRFATEEEKAFLEPKPVNKEPELKVGSWYSCEVYGFDLPVILCFNGTYGSSTQYGWDAYGYWSDRIGCYKEDVKSHIELSEIQVEQHLIKEAKRRGLVEGVKVQGLTLSGKYYFNTVGLWSTTVEGGDIVIFNNGRWAEPIKTQEVQKDVWVNVYPDGSEMMHKDESDARYDARGFGVVTVKGTLTYKI